MQENIKNQIIKLKTNILRARYNLIFIAILTTVNVLTVVSGKNAFMPFSIFISTFAASIGSDLSNEQGNNTFLYLGILLSVIAILSIVFCYIKSKNNSLFFVIALGIISVDTLVLLSATFCGYFHSSFIVDLIMHILTIIWLFDAIKAKKELGVINELSIETISSTDVNYDSDITEVTNSNELEKYDDDCEPIVRGEYEGLTVIIIIKDTVAELIINDLVCDSLDTSYMSEYELAAVVNGVEIYFQYKRTYTGETAYLYADNVLLDSFAKDFF